MSDEYKHNKIKSLIISQGKNNLPAYAKSGTKHRTLENSAEAMEEQAINVAEKAMNSDDPKLALDAAKAYMSWTGKGRTGKTTIIAENAQINQIENDPKKTEAILGALSDISLLTQGEQTIDGQIHTN